MVVGSLFNSLNYTRSNATTTVQTNEDSNFIDHTNLPIYPLDYAASPTNRKHSVEHGLGFPSVCAGEIGVGVRTVGAQLSDAL